MFIGRPSGTCTVSVTTVKIRLPDKYFGMFLAYSQDQYGISPHTMIALAAKETFATALYPEKDDSYFIVDKEDEILDSDIEALIAERQAARKEKNFARADEIRDELLAKGIVLKDTREGVQWKRA